MGRWGQEGDSGGGRTVAAAAGTGFPGHLGRMLRIPALSPRAVLSSFVLKVLRCSRVGWDDGPGPVWMRSSPSA